MPLEWIDSRDCFATQSEPRKMYAKRNTVVNVKDTARIHVAALLDPGVENERILAFAYPFNWNAILAVLRKIDPDKKFPADIEGEPRDLSKLDNSRGASLLKAFGRPGFTGFEETVRENVAGL